MAVIPLVFRYASTQARSLRASPNVRRRVHGPTASLRGTRRPTMASRASGAPMELWPINLRRARENPAIFAEKNAMCLSFLFLHAHFLPLQHVRALRRGRCPKTIGKAIKEGEKKTAHFASSIPHASFKRHQPKNRTALVPRGGAGAWPLRREVPADRAIVPGSRPHSTRAVASGSGRLGCRTRPRVQGR